MEVSEKNLNMPFFSHYPDKKRITSRGYGIATCVLHTVPAQHIHYMTRSNVLKIGLLSIWYLIDPIIEVFQLEITHRLLFYQSLG